MACTTLLVGKKATNDGSVMIARNDDSPSGQSMPKRMVVVHPEEQPRHYRSVISHVEMDLPEDPFRYTAMPNARDGEGIWAGAGANAAGVVMTATETITSNERVLGADPLVVKYETEKGETVPGGIGEEDIVTLTLPYIHTAREGVLRLGSLLEEFGTYESNGIAFADRDEIWWLESIGGHHWIAARVPDDRYVVMPNQFGLDHFDFEDAYGEQKEFMCSADLKRFIKENDLDLSLNGEFDPRLAFGSHTESDHVYNTPRAWYMLRTLNPRTYRWDGENADYTPLSDDLPWSMVPEHKITVEDVKDVLSSCYQGTVYDPYSKNKEAGKYRTIGINRTDFFGLLQVRPYMPIGQQVLEWVAYASNAFNTMVPFYTDVQHMPTYVSCTTKDITTDSFYWTSRLIAALSDAAYAKNIMHIERYREASVAASRTIIKKYDDLIKNAPVEKRSELCLEANEEIASMLKKASDKVLEKVLAGASDAMRNNYQRSDN